MVIDMLQERRVDLHLPREHGTQLRVHFVPRRNLLRPWSELAIRRNHAELLLPRESFSAHLVPALIKLSFVLRDPFMRHVMRRMRRAGREVHEERLVWSERFLLTNIGDRLVRNVLRQVIPLFGRLLGFDRYRAIVERRVVLAVLATDEPVEVFEARAGRPAIERPDGT